MARTYMNTFPDEEEEWIVLGRQSQRPDWLPSHHTYIHRDFTVAATTTVRPQDLEKLTNNSNLTQIVISLRPQLVTKRTNSEAMKYNVKMIEGFLLFLKELLSSNHNIQTVIHVSSIAAVGHLEGQYNQGLDAKEPKSQDLDQPYDFFKKRCEELILQTATTSNGERGSSPTIVTNVRLGAIFSDTPGCIQCNALALQAYAGPFIPYPIDCNSSRNVSHLIRLLLLQPKQQAKLLRHVYYYTRPLHHTKPIPPYGQYLVDYRQGNGIQYYLWIPLVLVKVVLALVHFLAQVFPSMPYLQSIDYLLQVSGGEHSFDNTAIMEDFPELREHEETIEACFRRRKATLST